MAIRLRTPTLPFSLRKPRNLSPIYIPLSQYRLWLWIQAPFLMADLHLANLFAVLVNRRIRCEIGERKLVAEGNFLDHGYFVLLAAVLGHRANVARRPDRSRQPQRYLSGRVRVRFFPLSDR